MISKSMEIWWKCNKCDAINNYIETKKCECCDEPIGGEDEVECIYKVADILYQGAVSADDFTEASDYFFKISHYKDSEKKCQACRQKAQKILMDEKKYAEAARHWETACNLEKAGSLADAEKEYALAEQQFRETIPFKESRQNCIKCQQTGKTVHQKRIYLQAEDAFSKAFSIADYENAARLFSEIAEFSDVKIRLEQCLKQIEELRMQELLKKASAQFEEADRISDNASRAAAFSRVLNEYKDYEENKQFTKLFCDGRDKLKATNNNIAYDAAVVLMNKAKKERDYTEAAAAFSVLSGFKDSDEKKAECVSRAVDCKKRESYQTAIEYINRSKKITLFNWRKYRW